MDISKEYAKIKTGFLREMSRLEQQKKLQTMKVISNLSSLRDLPGMKKFKQELARLEKKRKPAGPGPKIPTPWADRITRCFTAPFQVAMSHPSGNPVSLRTGRNVENIFNPYSFSDPTSGTMSLSVISGQNRDDFYSGGYSIDPNTGLRRQRSCGILGHVIDLGLGNLHAPTLVEIAVTVELPQRATDIVKLIPGGRLFGVVGAEGFLDVYAGVQRDFLPTGTSHKFLSMWKTIDQDESSPYDNNIVCKHSFVLPARQAKFWVNINAQVLAYSLVPASPAGVSRDIQQYSLIDLRSSGSAHHILSGTDHPAPGAIKVKKICVTYEPVYSRLEPGRNNR